jgi:hypothetical protein
MQDQSKFQRTQQNTKKVLQKLKDLLPGDPFTIQKYDYWLQDLEIAQTFNALITLPLSQFFFFLKKHGARNY